MAQNAPPQDTIARGSGQDGKFIYDRWMESRGVPVHRGYFIEDLRTIEVGPWAERECNAAFIQLKGQEGVSEAN